MTQCYDKNPCETPCGIFRVVEEAFKASNNRFGRIETEKMREMVQLKRRMAILREKLNLYLQEETDAKNNPESINSHQQALNFNQLQEKFFHLQTQLRSFQRISEKLQRQTRKLTDAYNRYIEYVNNYDHQFELFCWDAVRDLNRHADDTYAYDINWGGSHTGNDHDNINYMYQTECGIVYNTSKLHRICFINNIKVNAWNKLISDAMGQIDKIVDRIKVINSRSMDPKFDFYFDENIIELKHINFPQFSENEQFYLFISKYTKTWHSKSRNFDLKCIYDIILKYCILESFDATFDISNIESDDCDYSYNNKNIVVLKNDYILHPEVWIYGGFSFKYKLFEIYLHNISNLNNYYLQIGLISTNDARLKENCDSYVIGQYTDVKNMDNMHCRCDGNCEYDNYAMGITFANNNFCQIYRKWTYNINLYDTRNKINKESEKTTNYNQFCLKSKDKITVIGHYHNDCRFDDSRFNFDISFVKNDKIVIGQSKTNKYRYFKRGWLHSTLLDYDMVRHSINTKKETKKFVVGIAFSQGVKLQVSSCANKAAIEMFDVDLSN